MPHDIPSDDTFRQVFVALSPERLVASFAAWNDAVMTKTEGLVVVVDGKVLRRRFDRQSDKATRRIFSTWGSQNHLINENESLISERARTTDVAMMRRIILNLVRQDQIDNLSLRGKGPNARWDNNYLRQLLNF